jgi:hypothetical protein
VAIQREKELKGWARAKKIALIQAANPTWEDLSESWYSHLAEERAPRKADPSLRLPHVVKPRGAPSRYVLDDTEASNKEAAHSGGFFIAHLDRWF